MRLKFLIAYCLVFFVGQKLKAQDNIFLSRDYWKVNPTIAQVEKDIKAGNDPSQLNKNAFDAVVYALLEKANNTTIEHLLSKRGNDVNKITHDGRTYIFWAAYKGNLEMMKYLLKKGAKTDIIDSHGYSILNFAAVTGQRDMQLYDFLIANGANPKTEKNLDGANALLLVAPFLESDTMIDYFVAKGIDLHSTDSNGNGIFNYAAKKGNIKFLEILLAKGVTYKTPAKDGGNAFIFASQGTRSSSNSLESYKYLGKLGLNPNVTTKNGLSPLHALAYKNKDLEIFSYFIEKGVDVNQADSDGNTAFINAASQNDLKSISYLISYVTDINATNKKGQTALMMATQFNTPEAVDFIIKKGGDALAKDREGNTLAFYVLESYSSKNSAFDEKLKLLQEAGLVVNQSQANGQTLWHLAVKKNEIDLLKKIAQFHIPVNTKNDNSLTPLHMAAIKATDTEILKFLIERGADKKLKTDFDESVLDLALENELLQKQQVELNFLR